jgi:uncharacterized protein with HEPN domain
MMSYAEDAIELLGDADATALEGDKMRRYAVTYAMEIVGEAASQVTQSSRDALRQLPWRGAISTRNRLVHAYRGLDLEVMVSTVREDFPPLIAELERVLGDSAP